MDIYLFQRKTLKHLIECELSYITTGLFTMADQRHVSFIGNGENRNGRENVPSQPATTGTTFQPITCIGYHLTVIGMINPLIT